MADSSRQDHFVALIEQHKRILFKVANAYCYQTDDRADLVQEMIAVLWGAFEQYDEQYRFSTWMYRVALNVAISTYRRERRRTRHMVETGGTIPVLAQEESESDERDEHLRLLDQFIKQLDPLDRALILLYLDGHRHAIIAETLGISESNVGTKIGRIKARLRQDFARTDYRGAHDGTG